MKITIAARKTSVRDSFRERVEKKLSKLDRFFDDTAGASVTVTNEGNRETVEVTIQAHGMVYRAEKTTEDRLDSLDAVVDSLFRQIVKHKDKLGQRLRSNAFAQANVEEGEEQEVPVEEYRVVRTKRFVMRPMSVDEAILQMNLVGHAFFAFLNVQSDEMNIVYRRSDDTYGVLEPAVK